MLDKILSFIADWLQNYKPKYREPVEITDSFHYGKNWRATEDGIITMNFRTNSGKIAYIDVNDITESSTNGKWVAGFSEQQTAAMGRNGINFPVIKGHIYSITQTGGLDIFAVEFYEFRGGIVKVGISTILAFLSALGRRWDYVRSYFGIYREQNSSNTEQYQRFNSCKFSLEKRHNSRRKYNMDEYGLRYKRRNTKWLQIIRGILWRYRRKCNYLLPMPKEWRKNRCCSIQKLGKFKYDNNTSVYSYLHKGFITNDWGCLAC